MSQNTHWLSSTQTLSQMKDMQPSMPGACISVLSPSFYPLQTRISAIMPVSSIVGPNSLFSRSLNMNASWCSIVICWLPKIWMNWWMSTWIHRRWAWMETESLQHPMSALAIRWKRKIIQSTGMWILHATITIASHAFIAFLKGPIQLQLHLSAYDPWDCANSRASCCW